MGQSCSKGSIELGYPEKRTFKTDRLFEKWKRMQGTGGGGFTRTSLAKFCVGYKNGRIESKSEKGGLTLNCSALGKVI